MYFPFPVIAVRRSILAPGGRTPCTPGLPLPKLIEHLPGCVLESDLRYELSQHMPLGADFLQCATLVGVVAEEGAMFIEVPVGRLPVPHAETSSFE
jgi:hypothetical protein